MWLNAEIIGAPSEGVCGEVPCGLMSVTCLFWGINLLLLSSLSHLIRDDRDEVAVEQPSLS